MNEVNVFTQFHCDVTFFGMVELFERLCRNTKEHTHYGCNEDGGTFDDG